MVDLIDKSLFKDFVPPATQNTIADGRVEDRSLKRVQLAPMQLTGVLVDVLRHHFGNPTSIFEPLLQNHIWRPSLDTTILIETCTREVLKQLQQRPAILVKRNAIRFERFIIGDEVIPIGGGKGQREFVVRAQGAHSVFCITQLPADAETLAQETLMLLLQHGPQIRETLRLQEDFKLDEVGELRTLEGAGGQYVVPLSFSYSIVHAWNLKPTAPLIRHIQVKTHTQ
jgi:hypothetical protein